MFAVISYEFVYVDHTIGGETLVKVFHAGRGVWGLGIRMLTRIHKKEIRFQETVQPSRWNYNVLVHKVTQENEENNDKVIMTAEFPPESTNDRKKNFDI
jgi:hypothetical protein